MVYSQYESRQCRPRRWRVRQHGRQGQVNAVLDPQIHPHQKWHGNIMRIDTIDRSANSALGPPGHRIAADTCLVVAADIV